MREDFEIYEFTSSNGQHFYAFKVEYIGRWVARTEKEILKKREEVREYVRKRLEWVESENKKYYARLAQEERQRALSLKKAKDVERKAHDNPRSVRSKYRR